jgi:alkanesulfonate monooxygenase SsuD/methylene tetrahydromethanopterin reductase-like flavin-dependent oxidoreductase (luciferase family)
VAADEAELRERVAMRLEATGKDPADAGDFLAKREPDSLVGTLDEVAERLREYEAAGVTRVMLQHLAHEDLMMVERLGELARAVA